MRTCLVRAGNRHSLKTHSHWAGDEQEREMPGKVVAGGGAKRELWVLGRERWKNFPQNRRGLKSLQLGQIPVVP